MLSCRRVGENRVVQGADYRVFGERELDVVNVPTGAADTLCERGKLGLRVFHAQPGIPAVLRRIEDPVRNDDNDLVLPFGER